MTVLASVSVVCRSRPSIAALAHVALSLDAFLDPSSDWEVSDGVKFGSVRLLDRIAARIDKNDTKNCKKQDFPSSISIAMSLGDLGVVQWLIRRFPTGNVASRAVAEAAKNGHLSVLQWLFNHHDFVYWGGDEMYNAVAFNHLKVAIFLNQYTAPPPDDMYLIDEAARHGNLEMMRWLHEERGDQLTYDGVMRAVDKGFVDAVQWMVETFPDIVKAKNLRMDNAAANGHLEMVQWLHEQHAWCTKQAMNRAAGYGRLEVVTFLHENRSEGCTTDAMNLAAANGHLETVKWLHANRSEGCTRFAMDDAAANGHLEMVKWLHEHREEGCSARALGDAAKAGHLEIVQWLRGNTMKGVLLEVD